MKRVLIIAGVLFAILIAVAVTLPFLIPTSVYKERIETAATNALGREVTLKGDASLSIFPVIAARVDGVEIANPDGFSDPVMIEAGSLQASIKILPLLSQRVEVAQIALDDATVRLERLADGRVNWEFSPEQAPAPEDETSGSSGSLETGIDRAKLSNTAVFYRDWTTDTQYALTGFNATARLTALDKPLTSSGEGLINGQAFDYRIRLETIAALSEQSPVSLDLTLGTIYGNLDYDGEVTLSDEPTLDGQFDINSQTLGQALAILGDDDLPIVASALNAVSAKGSVNGSIETAALSFEKLTLAATGLDVDYTGSVQLGTTPTLDGTVDLNAADAQRLLKPNHPLIPLLAMLGDVDFEARLQGPVMTPRLTGIVLKQRSDDLSTDYAGSLGFEGERALDGRLTLSSSNPRAVLTALGTELPPGDTLNNLEISGQTSGSLLAPSLKDANILIDDTAASGSLGAELRGTRPRVTANLNMQELDLTPFFGAQQDPEPTLAEDWDDTPLDLAGLRAVDATVTVAADTVIMDQVTLNDALLNTRLDQGRLSAIFRRDDEAPGFKVFQGNWSGDLVLDASRSTPTLQINAIADSIAAQDMLTALTGLQNLKGLGDVLIDLSSEGTSIKSLINGLDGKFETDLNDGALRGLNLTKLVQSTSNLQTLMGNGGLTVASFQEAFSPNATTNFSKFIGSMDITNGVATLTDLNIDNPVVGVFGSGQIDLGARTLDIRLTPRIDVTAAGAGATIGVGDIPIPVRVYGSWSSVRFGLDSSAVQAELTSRLRGQAADEIADRIGGDAGAIIGGIIGGGSTPGTAEEDAPSLEDEIANRALGALFGTRDRNKDADSEDDQN
ncbi:MAG: AsmA family protein [Henriciella sp.]|nr:AsmA family protein [Henriciella sp.]